MNCETNADCLSVFCSLSKVVSMYLYDGVGADQIPMLPSLRCRSCTLSHHSLHSKLAGTTHILLDESQVITYLTEDKSSNVAVSTKSYELLSSTTSEKWTTLEGDGNGYAVDFDVNAKGNVVVLCNAEKAWGSDYRCAVFFRLSVTVEGKLVYHATTTYAKVSLFDSQNVALLQSGGTNLLYRFRRLCIPGVRRSVQL